MKARPWLGASSVQLLTSGACVIERYPCSARSWNEHPPKCCDFLEGDVEGRDTQRDFSRELREGSAPRFGWRLEVSRRRMGSTSRDGRVNRPLERFGIGQPQFDEQRQVHQILDARVRALAAR